MTPEQLIAWLGDPNPSQRDKLGILRDNHTATIRELSDDKYQAVIREIKKRLKSPKLAGELAALLGEIDRGRIAKPLPAAQIAEPPAVPFVGTVPDDVRGTELEAAIAADPDAQERYVVYGDYLAMQGDPRGELIAVGHALAKNPAHKAMLAAHEALLAKHGDRLLGPLPAHERKNVEWYLGFVKRMKLGGTTADQLAMLLDDPGAARFIQHLAIGTAFPNEGPYEPIVRVLASRPRPTLRSLTLGEHWLVIGDLSALWPALFGLRELALDGIRPILGELRLPQLARLSINYGPPEDVPHSISELASVLAADGVPALRTLAIRNCEVADELCAALAESKLLTQLTELDLSMGTLSDVGVDTIRRHRDRFAHLSLNVELNYVPDDLGVELASFVARLELGDQRTVDNALRGRHAADYE